MRENSTSCLRVRTRRAVKEALADTALELFEASGFEQVTVADIAKAAGISQRSFFRYFGSKEDVVLGDRIPTAEEVLAVLTPHLAAHPAWEALRLTVRSMTQLMEVEAEAERWKQAVRLICRTPGLRARYLEKHLAWVDALVPELTSRTGPGDARAELKAQTMVNTALSCFDVALTRWSDEEGEQRSLAALVEEVFGFVRIPSEEAGV
ncbi:TetR family transcriptional regulator [Streptomyces physcomitrii]|uniref:TetR/AcrR family transcriptional regulator n=1 Tax=Streptomyces physcomitrii TaxID=2724184 RepID=UPI00343E3CEF